ncbi:MAG: potassium transporter Trk [Candidatus Cloacimonetes bacterium HGW-Cloacimonetes-1]|nr:MAG: potassium transporter Trk [Candidatus Cloacimonetes bacterium HGW-Cloacimonetes-1]
MVLFLGPLIQFYLHNYARVERITAIANILLLSLTILTRLSMSDIKANQKIIVSDLIMLLLGSLLMIYQAKFVIFFLLTRQTYFILMYIIFRSFEGKFYKFMSTNPPTTLMLSFVFVILIGTVLLMLPAASQNNNVTTFIDALFTATSATCVTGLVVLDTWTYFSTFGQLVILVLIQIGGLGIMTISTAFALMIGQRITLKLENILQNVVGGSTRLNLFQLLKSIVLVTAIIEAIGAALLYRTFAREMEPLKALYFSVFHSISAFCNAGFSFYSNGFENYMGDINLNLTITLLIILGGIGFTVIIDIQRYLFVPEKVKRLTLHSKVVLVTTASLLLLGFLAFFVVESQHTMKDLPMWQRALGAWFQSVTARTAGFNTVNIGRFGPASLLVMMGLMFIGASPGSTGGGIKTSTFVILILSVTSMLKGHRDLSIFNRKIAVSNIREATSLTTLSILIILVIVFLLLMLEPFKFDEILFESVSAFGTVGLSMGITGKLSATGRVLITLLMYIGRIGPLTLIYAFAIRRRTSSIQYAEEQLAVG